MDGFISQKVRAFSASDKNRQNSWKTANYGITRMPLFWNINKPYFPAVTTFLI
jgi:hypothetical protein